ncbi:MAG: lamin tail domain-containing protein [Bacteroidales bacterium]|nr:lamin tail domain-containing protein [Bacteroidales bacterium]
MKKILFAALALIVMMASCVKDQQYPGVTITNVTYTPTAVQADMPVTVSATIASFNPFTAKLYYNLDDGAYTAVDMTATPEKDVYNTVIPGQPDGVKVAFYIVAEGTLVATSPTMEYTVGAIAVDYSVLRLNELNGNDKFIEIYNAGPEMINMNGVAIYKDTEKMIWTGKSAVNVEAGGYLLLYSEDVVEGMDIDTSLYMFHSGLSAKKNVRIELKTPAGVTFDDFNLINIELNGEAYGYGNNQAPASYSLNSDGQWYYSDATPGAANIDGENIVLGLEGGVTPPEPPTPEPDYTNLVLNELNGDTKFIEFYNKGDLDLSMEGMYLTKDGNEEDIKWTGDATHVVPAHGYLVLYSVDTQADHPELGDNMFFNSGLSAKKTVRFALYMADGAERDVFTRGNTGEWGQTISNVAPQSYARTPDGGDWKLADPTPGEANPATGEDIPQE